MTPTIRTAAELRAGDVVALPCFKRSKTLTRVKPFGNGCAVLWTGRTVWFWVDGLSGFTTVTRPGVGVVFRREEGA